MLFWAGLRGAVGVALAAGITGENADALRTTILVVVVLTVVIFGGTTARMLEILGIRVGVEDDDDSSDDEGGWAAHGGNLALAMGPGSRKFAGLHPYGDDYDDGYSYGGSPLESPYGPSGTFPLDSTRRSPSANGLRLGPRGNSRRQASTGYSAGSSSESEDIDLPNATDVEQGRGPEDPASAGMVFRDGQWFTQLDERYLLPLFSNSVASRRHNLKKTLKRSGSTYGGESSPTTPRGPSLDWGNREGGGHGDGDSESGKGKGLSRNFRSVYVAKLVISQCADMTR
jgi:sodium/hydrogen exchanger-like protein 6/7